MISKETETHLHYTANFAGQTVNVVRNKATNQTYFDISSVAIALGYASAEALMSDPFAVEMIREQNQQAGNTLVCRTDKTTGDPIIL